MRLFRRRPAAAVLTVVATMAGAVVTVGPAAADETWKVPASARIKVLGHGYGHGHGMSQYGAEGAAREGLAYRDILGFYYPGTKWGEAAGKVSVLLTAATSDDLVVLARNKLALRDLATSQRTLLPDNGASRWRIRPGKGAHNIVDYLAGGGWHRFATTQGEAQLGARGRPVTLVTPTGTTTYRGQLRSVADSGRSRDVVNIVSLENYIKGVVPLEMPALWDPEAVRAQAVAARTYAAYERDHPLGSGYQICDTWSCQVYGGVSAEHPASNEAVAATRHQVLVAGGKPAFTQFGASSGGWTSAGSVKYLAAREDPYDSWSGNPVHSWDVTVTDADLERTWPAVGQLRKIVVTSRDGNGDWGGRLQSLVLVGSKGRVPVSGDTFRAVLGLRSTWATFKVRRAAARPVPARSVPARADWALLAADLSR